MFSVIIPSYRNPEYLDLCLHSIVSNQSFDNEVVVVLDGYVEENQEVIEKYPMVSWLPFEENHGMQTAINFGVWNAKYDKLVIINDDNVFPEKWDIRLNEVYDTDTVTTINQIEPTGPGMFAFPVVDCGTTVDTFNMDKFLQADTKFSNSKITSDGNIFPFVINRKWFMAVGGFDTYYNSPNLCDWDFFLKLELIPTIKRVRTHNLHLYHFGSVATKKNKESDSFRQREAYAIEQYMYKWKFAPYNGVNNTKIPPGAL